MKARFNRLENQMEWKAVGGIQEIASHMRDTVTCGLKTTPTFDKATCIEYS